MSLKQCWAGSAIAEPTEPTPRGSEPRLWRPKRLPLKNDSRFSLEEKKRTLFKYLTKIIDLDGKISSSCPERRRKQICEDWH
jgi:hypothetical protein